MRSTESDNDLRNSDGESTSKIRIGVRAKKWVYKSGGTGVGEPRPGNGPGRGPARSALVVRQISRSGRELGVALDDLQHD